MHTTKKKSPHGRDSHEVPSAIATAIFDYDLDLSEQDSSSSDNDDHQVKTLDSSDEGNPRFKNHDGFLEATGSQRDPEYSISYGHSEAFLKDASGEQRRKMRTGSLLDKLSLLNSSPKQVPSTPLPETKPWSPFDDDDEDDDINALLQSRSAPPTPGFSALSSMFPRSASGDPALSNLTSSSTRTLSNTPSPLSSSSTPTLSNTSPRR